MTKARLLITGASGFVGSRILERLDHRFDVHAVSRSVSKGHNATWYDADLLDPASCSALIRDIRPSHLIHSAWETTHGAFWDAESNLKWLEAGKSLFSEFCAAGGERIVACGTCAEYNGAPNPLRESDDTSNPASLYGRAKVELLGALSDMPVSYAWARIFYPYGTTEGQKRFIPSICQSLANGVPAECSSGTQIRNFINVDDLGAAIAKLADHKLTGPINLGHPTSNKLEDIAKMLGEIAGRPDLIRLGALPDRVGEPPVLIPDLTRQITELKFNPLISLRDGLNATYNWWKNRLQDNNIAAQL